MRCPFCRCRKLKVLYTNNVLSTSKFRRRVCLHCKKSFPTLETIIQEKDAMDSFNTEQNKIIFPEDIRPAFLKNPKPKPR